MITVVNQAEADRDISKLLRLKKRFGISVGRPLDRAPFGSMDLRRLRHPEWVGHTFDALTGYVFDSDGRMIGREFEAVDWVIVGGELAKKLARCIRHGQGA